jgi:hypothetical protein
MTISVSSKNSQIPSQKIVLFEQTHQLSNMMRIMNNSDAQRAVATNRFKFSANNIIAYVCACNDGVLLNGIKYIAEPSINHGNVCQNCGYANCRSSKKKPCTSKARCLKCSEMSHKVSCTVKKSEYCVNCEMKGHRCTHDGYCEILQQKTFDNNSFLLPILLGEGIKETKYHILRNYAIAVENVSNKSDGKLYLDTLNEIVETYVSEKVIPRISKLEERADITDARFVMVAEDINGMKSTLKEVGFKLDSSAATNKETNSDVKQLMALFLEMLGARHETAPPSPPGES